MFSKEAIKKISDGRKKWLKDNPGKHPWRKKDKFVSAPCEYLKEKLTENNISFEEEVIVSNDKNYSVDILISSKNLIIEVNGNQHYEKNGSLKPYYKERHEHITSLGWKVIELHYTMAYNIEMCLDLIKREPEYSIVLPFKKREPVKRNKYGKLEDYLKASKIKYEEENIEYIRLVEEAEIDFSKFGWVKKVSSIINKKPQKVNNWMKRFMPSFYEEKCYKKKSTES